MLLYRTENVVGDTSLGHISQLVPSLALPEPLARWLPKQDVLWQDEAGTTPTLQGDFEGDPPGRAVKRWDAVGSDPVSAVTGHADSPYANTYAMWRDEGVVHFKQSTSGLYIPDSPALHFADSAQKEYSVMVHGLSGLANNPLSLFNPTGARLIAYVPPGTPVGFGQQDANGNKNNLYCDDETFDISSGVHTAATIMTADTATLVLVNGAGEVYTKSESRVVGALYTSDGGMIGNMISGPDDQANRNHFGVGIWGEALTQAQVVLAHEEVVPLYT